MKPLENVKVGDKIGVVIDMARKHPAAYGKRVQVVPWDVVAVTSRTVRAKGGLGCYSWTFGGKPINHCVGDAIAWTPGVAEAEDAKQDRWAAEDAEKLARARRISAIESALDAIWLRTAYLTDEQVDGLCAFVAGISKDGV